MPYYESKDGSGETEKQKAAWTDIARYVRGLDPFRRPLTTHPRQKSWEDLLDPALLDFQMLQTGHMAAHACQASYEWPGEGRARFPAAPVVNAEPAYEGHMGLNGPEVQRYLFWATLLSGGAGFTYGAAGIFQANDRDRPTGDRPSTGPFDADFWDDAMHFPGAAQLARFKELLAGLPFPHFESHPEWVDIKIAWGAEHYRPPFRAFCAGVPGQCRVVYIPARFYHWDGPLIKDLESGVRYRASYHRTVNCQPVELGEVKADSNRCWQAPGLPYLYDWLLVLRKV